MKTVKTDQIIEAVHILWERGWKATPESVQEMLVHGCLVKPEEIKSLDTIKNGIAQVPQTKEKWLSGFNFNSPWAIRNPRPWEIDDTWHHQEQEAGL